MLRISLRCHGDVDQKGKNAESGKAAKENAAKERVEREKAARESVVRAKTRKTRRDSTSNQSTINRNSLLTNNNFNHFFLIKYVINVLDRKSWIHFHYRLRP